PPAAGLSRDEALPARHGRVVEAHVGREAPPDASPLALERRDADAAAVVPGQVLARLGDHGPSAGHQRPALLPGWLVTGPALEPPAREQRGTGEARSAAPGAVRQRVGRGQCHDVAAFLASEGPGTRKGP